MDSGKITTTGERAVGSAPVRSWRTNMPVASNPAGSDGICTAILGPVPSQQVWMVEWSRIKCDSSSPTALEMFKNTIDDLHSIDSIQANITVSANDNVEYMPQPGIYLGEGETCIFVWSSASLAAVGKVTSQVKVSSGG